VRPWVFHAQRGSGSDRRRFKISGYSGRKSSEDDCKGEAQCWCHRSSSDDLKNRSRRIRFSGGRARQNVTRFPAAGRGRMRRDSRRPGKCAGGGTRTLTSLCSTDFRTVYGFRRPAVRRWVCGLDYPFTVPRIGCRRLGAARLVSTPSRSAFPGLARDCHFTGFPEFGQFCIAGFPASTQVWTQVRCVCHSATPAWPFPRGS
jgi:hypothetical protein